MSAPEQATSREMRWIGIGLAAAGLYCMLIGLEILPVPGGRASLHGPLWLALLIGFVLALAGAAAFIQATSHTTVSGDLPADAPLWLRLVHYLVGVTMFACFATIATWVAVGGDPRYFSGGVPFLSGPLNVAVARIVFSLGALICWLGAIAYAVAGVRKLLRRDAI